MNVAGEINVVDPRTLEHGCLLSPDVWRKQEDPILRSAGGQGRSTSVQLLDYDPDILVAEVSLLLDEVPSHTPGGLPCDDAVEQGQSASGRANLGVRHPLPQSRPVHVKVGRGCHPGHVRKSSTFINDERMVFVNAKNAPGSSGQSASRVKRFRLRASEPPGVAGRSVDAAVATGTIPG